MMASQFCKATILYVSLSTSIDTIFDRSLPIFIDLVKNGIKWHRSMSKHKEWLPGYTKDVLPN